MAPGNSTGSRRGTAAGSRQGVAEAARLWSDPYDGGDRPWSRRINGFADDEQGRLWLTTEDSEVVRFADDEFRDAARVWHDPDPIPCQVRNDHAGHPWVMSLAALARLEADGPRPVLTGSAGEYEFHCPSRAGGWWIRSGAELRRWQEGRWVARAGRPAWTDRTVQHALEDREGHLWIASLGGGVFQHDADGDGMPNAYETAHGLNPNSNDAEQDLDNDGLKNLAEFQRGTAANKTDTDGDGLKDGVETGTGVYVSPADTGTNPLKNDTDNDGLGVAVETNSGNYVSSTNTGTDPSKPDTDGDGFSDGLEVGAGFNPTQLDSTPAGTSSIRTAVEFQFFAAPGVSYRIEGSADLQTWTTVEAASPGAGNRVTRLYSTEGKPFRFFRAVAN